MIHNHSSDSGPPFPFRDLSPAIEFCCWVVVGLAPILRWINGAAVTSDQFVVQCTLFGLALTGALALRYYHWRVRSVPPADHQA